MADRTITFTADKLKAFRRAYAIAPQEGETFLFEGHKFVKGYAKPLIEYLEGQLKVKRTHTVKHKDM